ncbi:unnamed protein product [Linum tenue]|uniref:DYW domain-containing protein n=1 Tax=Linum tenue TaxID=586396 RepID=A0AAV0HAZ1_9ROSI|nr:unnamed protein product [Linum tenue]
MVDLMGRAGLLSDAYKLIISMPMKPNSGVWGALMGACKKHNNIELGKEAFDNMLALEPLDSRNYLSLSNMYSSAGEVREDMINKHSEKLAIAFGLMVSANLRMPLVITKNLRICGDCHEFAKVVSRLEGREIIIRDKKRFHHFSNGSCSCRDYW